MAYSHADETYNIGRVQVTQISKVVPLRDYANTNYQKGHENGLEEILVMDHVDTHDICKVAFGYVFTRKELTNG